MRSRIGVLGAVLLCVASTASMADLAPYVQNFEGLDASDPGALAADGWLVFGNVFDPGGNYLYGYGPFPAPNDGAAFCAIAVGEGGAAQGAQQLSVYSDYNNGDHGGGNLIEANVFQEQIVGAADVDTRWRFGFNAKRGNLAGATTALAFIKTLDPSAGFALTNFITFDTTNIPETWGSYKLFIDIDSSLVGQILQVGFVTVATNYEPSGNFYDNVTFKFSDPLYVEMASLSATATDDGVLIQWETAVEVETAGFRVLREQQGTRVKSMEVIQPFVYASGTAVSGASYEVLDSERRRFGRVLYYIEDIDLLGRVTRHGPIEVQHPSGTGGSRSAAGR